MKVMFHTLCLNNSHHLQVLHYDIYANIKMRVSGCWDMLLGALHQSQLNDMTSNCSTGHMKFIQQGT